MASPGHNELINWKCETWKIMKSNTIQQGIDQWAWWPTFSKKSWWRHQMKTFSALLAFCAGNSPVTGESSSQRPVTQSFDVFFDLRLNKCLSKQPRRQWFETPLCSLWRHCNDHTLPFRSTGCWDTERQCWCCDFACHVINSLWPSDSIWRHRSAWPL